MGATLPQCVLSDTHTDTHSVTEAWSAALEASVALLESLHVDESDSTQWQRVADDVPDNVGVAVMRRRMHATDVYRATWEGACAPSATLEAFHAALQTRELAPQWLPMVEGCEVLETLEPHTHISKLRFRLGWPASPRDAVVISHIVEDSEALMYVAASLPRTTDAPSYLRPAPPYIRAHVHLLAILVRAPRKGRAALTGYWCIDGRGSVLGMRPTALTSYLPRMLPSLASFVAQNGNRLPYIDSYGVGIALTHQCAAPDLHVAYAVLGDVDDTPTWDRRDSNESLPVHSLVLRLPSAQGWNVRVHGAPEHILLERDGAWLVLTLTHEAPDPDTLEHIELDVTAGEPGVHVNGELRVDAAVVDTNVFPKTHPLLERLRRGAGEAKARAMPEADAPAPAPESTAVAATAPTVARDHATSALAATVRRNYIYFASLLQEPEAKWRRHSDARGVTVTQLDSIDPTLVVYRAEATFVGLSVWDLYAALCHPSLAGKWDELTAGAAMLADLGGQSTAWHVWTRGSWSVSARDAVLVQTSYKSPTAIHMFAFSAEDAEALGVPAVPLAPGTVRTQVDLRGWSLEALSPTTVHVTLVEQSDPGGWQKKTALPAQMISALAGAGEYALRRGAPPIVSRMLNARVCEQTLDAGTSTFALAYDADIGDPEGDRELECELRCDLEVWAANIDVVVSPPPSNVSCLRRHRFASGGGLWLTLEHDSAEQVSVQVRKGPPAAERGVVLLNGLRVRVDSDELDAAQIHALMSAKRGRPQRVPLDFVGTPQMNPLHAPCEDELAAAADTDTGAVGERSTAPAPVSAPMHAALGALFFLRRINAERHPDPAGVPAGWSLVSERQGLYIRRKLIPSLSGSVSVLRADKVVRGVAAEELLALVTYPGSRPQWDETLATFELLESYGSGATASWLTTRPSFPFASRGFLVTSLTAHGSFDELPSPSAATSPTTVRQPVYYHATASTDATDRFDMRRLNAGGLTVGRVLVDGWIFETVDPYSSANYPIPSTRCTHIVAVDYGLPASINALWNATLPRAVLRLEQLLAKHGPPPALRVPPAWLCVRGDGRDDDSTLVWALRRARRATVLLASDFDQHTLRVLALVGGTRADPRASPSVRRVASRGAKLQQHDGAPLVVVDALLELQYFPYGYAISVTYAEMDRAADLAVETHTLPDDTLPLQIAVLDMPTSALQAATRFTENRTHQHRVRVTLPAAAAARWTTRTAAVRLTVAPLPQGDAAVPLGHVPVTCNGRVAEIVSGEEAVASADHGTGVLDDELERVPAGTSLVKRDGWDSVLGADVLAHPVARTAAWQPAAPAPPAVPPVEHASEPAAGTAHAAAVPPSNGASHATSPLFSLLRPPLSMASFVSRAPVKSGDDENAQPPGSLKTAETPVASRSAGCFHWSTFVLVMIVAFLAGSLMRALLAPTDFLLAPGGLKVTDLEPMRAPATGSPVVVDRVAREIDNFVRAARQLHLFARQEHDATENARDTPMERWREMLRFVDAHIPGTPWNVVVGLVRR